MAWALVFASPSGMHQALNLGPEWQNGGVDEDASDVVDVGVHDFLIFSINQCQYFNLCYVYSDI